MRRRRKENNKNEEEEEGNNRNVADSFTIHEAVLKMLSVGSMWGRCGVDVRSIGGRCICGWKNI